jgi:predicted RNA binding protein YcfA (HicA-like mRNA interferase family)
VKALEKAGFRIVRQGKHIVMSDGSRIVTVPRSNPVNAFTMGGIIRDAGLSIDQFRKLLSTTAPRTTRLPVGRSPRAQLRWLRE